MSKSDAIRCPFCRGEIDYSLSEVVTCDGCGAFIDAVAAGDIAETLGALREIMIYALDLDESVTYPPFPEAALVRDDRGNPIGVVPDGVARVMGVDPSCVDIRILPHVDDLRAPDDESFEEAEEHREMLPAWDDAWPITLIVLLRKR